MKTIVLTVLWFTLTSAQFRTNGTCPSFMDCRGHVGIRHGRLTGIWYLYASIPYFFHENTKCLLLNVTKEFKPNSVRLRAVEIDKS